MPGEGELKCIDWLKLMSQKESEEDAVIVGGDADLILQGLALHEVIAQQQHDSIFNEYEKVDSTHSQFVALQDFGRCAAPLDCK